MQDECGLLLKIESRRERVSLVCMYVGCKVMWKEGG